MLSNLFSKKEKVEIPWNILNNNDQLDQIDESSKQKPILLFKHSTSCPISAMALNRFEREYQQDASFDLYYLDLIAFRDISNEIANRYEVRHESPQVLLIKNGSATFNTSHTAISFEEVKEEAAKN